MVVSFCGVLTMTSSSAFRVKYDRASDVLYVSKRAGVPALTREGQPGILWRYATQGGDLVGVTIVDFGAYWGSRRPALVAQLAGRFHIPPEDAREILESAEP
jgi:uncharacterized protein YuzE